jgi:hypothetical protein
MKKNSGLFFVLSILVLLVLFSGCEMIFPPVTYEATPTQITYDLIYGYHVTTTGNGRYEISYYCDTPEVLIGTATYNKLYNKDVQTQSLFNNSVIYWNISNNMENTFDLGITTHVETTSYLQADLSGKNALTIKETEQRYPDIIAHYTQVQGNETIRFIDPVDTNIKTIAESIYINGNTNNSFLVAKSLFSWMKQNVSYQIHPDERAVRSASKTLSYKQGDCDDLSFLYISLCRAVGIPARFIRGYLITTETNGSIVATPHAWTEIFVGEPGPLNGWIPVECACCTTSIVTDINQNFGVESAFHLRLYTDDGSNASLATSLSGISYITHDPSRTISLESFAEVRNYQELESKQLIVTNDNIRHYE